ncbi:MAG: hypothetical protein Q9212_007384 [Teloschistes hypoglaucus]
MSESSAQILFLHLEDYDPPEFFDDLYGGICSQISAKYTTKVVKDAPDVQRLLSSPSLKVILAVNGTLSQGKFTALQKQLARFVKAGGVLVFCCHFSNSLCPPNADKMWKNFDLPWTYGEYYRTTYYLSQKAKTVFGSRRAVTLEREYSMKAVHLQHSTVNSRVYVPLEQSRTQSMVFPPDTVDQNESPAAWTVSGNGWLGYIGDVNNEAGSRKLLKVMLGKSGIPPRRHRHGQIQANGHRNGHGYRVQCCYTRRSVHIHRPWLPSLRVMDACEEVQTL